MLVLTGHERVATGITILTTVLTVSLGLWATRQFGALGLASVFSASALLENILKLFFARRLTGVWTHANLSSLAVRNLKGKGLPKLSDWC
ncbi:MAG: hypothetical protein JSV66_04845 [Trueperaceae bacterium]|nr:MAG: hypothetical protein JSV66_04845 [Trueperaceae bacterium]